MEKLVIDPVVQAILGPSSVARLADMREHTDVVCIGCRRTIPPEDPTPATVVVGVSENTVLSINFAHEGCARSQVYDIDGELDLVELLTDVRFVAYPILRGSPAFPRAMIVFEFAVTLLSDDFAGDDRQKRSFLRRGWEPVTDSWYRFTAGRVEGLLVRRRGDELVVDEHDGELLAFSNDTPPPGWWEVVAGEDACLLLYGSGLGLDRISMERVNAALQASACVAATARVEGWAELELVTESEQTASLDRRHADVSSREPGGHILIEADKGGGGDRYVTVYEDDCRRCAPWFRLSGPAIDDLEAAIERAAESGAPPHALAAGLEALAQGERENAGRVVRDSVGL